MIEWKPQNELTSINQADQKKCMLCHCWYFLDTGCRNEPEVCNGCHDVSMMAFELKILQY